MLVQSSFAAALALLTSLASTTALPSPLHRRANPAAFFLAGDSTTATQSANGGGWGDGFLNTTLHNSAIGTNYGHNGRTTATYRSDGYWATVLSAVSSHAANYTPYVTIQFGHNDQKSTSGLTVAQFQANLQTMAQEVLDAGGVPVLVTPLSRRTFSGGKVVEDLADMAAATKAAAGEVGVAVVDLNRESTDYLNAIGESDAHSYNLNADDNTHLNVEGSVVFGNMVSGLLDAAVEGVDQWTSPEEAIWTAIQNGQYIWP